MEWVETTGRSVEEAKEAALDQLGVDEQDAEFEIVEEPRFGLFGRLRSEARVRARVRPTKPRPKDDRRDRRGRRRTTGPDSATTELAVARTGLAEGPSDADSPASSEQSATADADDESDRDGSDGPTRAASNATHHRRRRRSSSPSRPREADGETRDRARSERPVPVRRPRQEQDSNNDPSRGGGMDVSLDEQGEVAKEFLEGLLDRMGLEADIVIDRPEDETIELNMQGQDLGLLIGAKGATLLALQDLTRTVVQRKTSASNGRLLVDVAGYRRKRKEALMRFSRQVAEEVQATGTRRVLEPMTAADRKIVHDTVNGIDGVMTSSEGEEPRRRVVILPVEH